MRKVFKKILEILDGTPAVYGKSQRGQSVLELALISPLLIILLAGMAEIGWFAQNYLTIMEVTRVGARTGTGQQGTIHPLYWEDKDNDLWLGSFPPNVVAPGNPGYTEYVQDLIKYRTCDTVDPNTKIGFYNFLGCIMLRSMDPLPFHVGNDEETGDPYPDDIVISAFAVQSFNPLEIAADIRADIDWPLATNLPQAIVVGRYPSAANECSSSGERDPFDFIQDGDLTSYLINGRTVFLELHQIDEVGDPVPYMDAVDAGSPENQRGFVWQGQHIDPETACMGSNWTTREVEMLINLQNFDLVAVDRGFVPSQGIVLVEMYWQHETLSQFLGLAPVLSPVFAILGAETTISVWAAFPLPTVEPRLQLPPA